MNYYIILISNHRIIATIVIPTDLVDNGTAGAHLNLAIVEDDGNARGTERKWPPFSMTYDVETEEGTLGKQWLSQTYFANG